MLLEELEFKYAYVGCCMVEYPRWLSLVLRAVGLIGEGETGVRGCRLTGDLSDRDGREFCAVFVEILRANLGFMLREASILTSSD